MRATMVALVALIALLTAPAPAAAEWLLDLFAGGSITQDADVEVTVDGIAARDTQGYKASVTAGGRLGYWFGMVGVALDASYFRPEFDPDRETVVDPLLGPVTAEMDLSVTGIGLSLLVRGQALRDPRVPEGRFQPYVFAGPMLFVSSFDIKIQAPAVGVAIDESDTVTTVGLGAGVGATYMFARNVGAFAEYRFTYQEPEFDLDGVEVETPLSTHHVVGGVTFRF